ncbi:MAG: ATP-binding protein [Prevotella sp.]
MKTRVRQWFVAALLLAPVLLCACSGKKTAGTGKFNDSLYTSAYIAQLGCREPDRALAIIDTLEILKKHPAFYINYMRCSVYNNSSQYRSAIHYGTLAVSDPLCKEKKPEVYLETLFLIAQGEYMQDNCAQSIKLMKQALEMANERGFENIQSKCYFLLGNVQIDLGDNGEALKSFLKAKEIAVKMLNAKPDFQSFETVFSCTSMIIKTLSKDNKYSEAEKYLPELLGMLEKAKTIKDLTEPYIDMVKWKAYAECFTLYNFMGKTEEAEKYRLLSEDTKYSKMPFSRERYTAYYISKKDYRQALANIDITKQFFQENRDTLCIDYYDAVLSHEFNAYKGMGNYAIAVKTAEKMLGCRDSIDKKTKEENAAELAKIYETQEKEKQIAEQEAKLNRQKYILVGVVVLLVIGAVFIMIVMRFSRRVNRRNKTIVATINQMMQKENELTRMQLTDDAKNVNPEEIRLKQSLEMLKEDKTIGEIVTECGYRDANDFGKKFYEHFGIHAEEYRKWSKTIGKQEKAGDDEAKQMKDSFIKNMSHEIRTPLNQIFGFVQLLTDPNFQLSDDEKRQYNEIIGEQTNYMTRMLNKFLEISEYESSDEPLPKETVAIDDLFNEVNAVVPRPQAGVELTFSNNSGLDTVETSYKGLARILQCLVGNAVKFTSEGYISVECTTNADGNTVFAVTDTGKGITEGDEERIFDRFYKVDDFVPGAGLGLPLVREIAKRMGATVILDRSYQSQGSRFVVTLRA